MSPAAFGVHVGLHRRFGSTTRSGNRRVIFPGEALHQEVAAHQGVFGSPRPDPKAARDLARNAGQPGSNRLEGSCLYSKLAGIVDGTRRYTHHRLRALTTGIQRAKELRPGIPEGYSGPGLRLTST